MSGQEEYFREQAIPFVIYNSEKEVSISLLFWRVNLKLFIVFEINDEAIEFLKSLSHPLGVISVAGMYRTGKSYLLNRMLLNRAGGFGVGPTINPCTKVSLKIEIRNNDL